EKNTKKHSDLIIKMHKKTTAPDFSGAAPCSRVQRMVSAIGSEQVIEGGVKFTQIGLCKRIHCIGLQTRIGVVGDRHVVVPHDEETLRSSQVIVRVLGIAVRSHLVALRAER